MSVGQHYTGDAGERYFAWQRRSGQFGARLNARKFAPHIPPDATLVDFGCGGGFLLTELAAREKIGIEPNATARASGHQLGLRMVASATELDGGIADVIVSNHALEHTLSPLDELRGLMRILKPGGKLVVWLPLDDWRKQRHRDPGDVNHHLYTWTPMLLGNLLEEAGFSVAEVRAVTRAWPPGVHVLSRLPPRAFEVLSFVWSVVDRRRQLVAVAFKP